MDLREPSECNEQSIRAAGPRYTPGIDPNAPNLMMRELNNAISALALGPDYLLPIRALKSKLDEAIESSARHVSRVFKGRTVTPSTLTLDLGNLLAGVTNTDRRRVMIEIRRHSNLVAAHLDKHLSALYERFFNVSQDQTQDGEQRRLDNERRSLRELEESVDQIVSYSKGSLSELLVDKRCALLLGMWGTGKTHFLCDTARNLIEHNVPTLLVLASSLPMGTDLLDAIASQTGQHLDASALLDDLDRLGALHGRRALILVDAINEGDRSEWRRQMPKLIAEIHSRPNVGLVVTCRRSFEGAVLTSSVRSKMVELQHYGFLDQEFDAQQVYFTHYDIPAPTIPPLMPEFANPLFLKLFCVGVAKLSPAGKHRQLRDVASGQKGMTYVLENFVREVGAHIETDFQLTPKACWILLKGEPSRDNMGLAGEMAKNLSDFVTRGDVLSYIGVVFGLSVKDSEVLLRRLIVDGLLSEDVRWKSGVWVEVIRFPYQRFGDHLIARHLLDTHLDSKTATVISIRRSLYAGKPLGSIFELDQWRGSFASPGLAAALIIEFPERMKRTGLPRELIRYVPKKRLLLRPVMEVLVEGLYWRPADSFTPETDSLVGILVDHPDSSVRQEMMEVLVGLATRSKHPYNASRLYDFLSRKSMAERDATWSEFLRYSEHPSNVYRLLSWTERIAEAKRSERDPSNSLRLLSLFLTTTSRPLRDRATHAIMLTGLEHPKELFDETLFSFDFNDPYVVERMLAASYGVVMRLWSSSNGARMRRELTSFARNLMKLMFLPDSNHSTTHVLQRDYALGIIELARKVDKHSIANRQIKYLRVPQVQIRSRFPDPSAITNADVKSVNSVIQMDFGNYTLGRLIRDRSNYDMSSDVYKEVRRQLLWRVKDLGYSSKLFEKIDEFIGRGGWDSSSSAKVDRYGKKYSWIAYFELYGVRSDLDELDVRRVSERTSDPCDIDPSFPEPPASWKPDLPDVFSMSPTDAEGWLREGGIPDFRSLLRLSHIGETEGPWVLLYAFVLQSSGEREAFSFIRGLFASPSEQLKLERRVKTANYLGNSRIPDAESDYYTFAGEIPWSSRFGNRYESAGHRASRGIDRALEVFGRGRWSSGIRVEVPVRSWAWEGYHSDLNQAGSTYVPNPSICRTLDLRGQDASFDLIDPHGKAATIYREWPDEDAGRFRRSQACFIREDLLLKYLSTTNRTMLWIPWGERGMNYRLHDRMQSESVREIFDRYEHVYSSLVNWRDVSSRSEVAELPA